jgi:hypothetical protein
MLQFYENECIFYYTTTKDVTHGSWATKDTTHGSWAWDEALKNTISRTFSEDFIRKSVIT